MFNGVKNKFSNHPIRFRSFFYNMLSRSFSTFIVSHEKSFIINKHSYQIHYDGKQINRNDSVHQQHVVQILVELIYNLREFSQKIN